MEEMIELILFIIYVIGAAVMAIMVFQDYFELSTGIIFTIGWPIIILFAIGYRVFS